MEILTGDSEAGQKYGIRWMLRPAIWFATAYTIVIIFHEAAHAMTWAPRHAGRVGGLLGLVVVPSLVGTALVVLVNQPTPMGPSFVTARAGEGAFWLFAALGLLITRQRRAADVRPMGLYWMDGAVALLVLLMVKIMARGILLMPSDS